MGVNRSRVRAPQKKANGQVESFALTDGSRYYYFDGQQAALAIFMYAFEKTLREEEEPRVLEFIRVVFEEAANPRAVLQTFRTGDPSKMFCDPVDLLGADDPHSTPSA
jgi:hypothetical protein